MSDKDSNFPVENFSDNPEENLRIENELLKLKMQAENGAMFGGEGSLSPEIENAFLMNVQQFENAWKDVKYIKVYDLIGRPAFKPVSKIPANEVKTELKRLTAIMNEKSVYLDVLGEYEPSVIYKFITEELFEHETDDLQLPGWTNNFIYEEFHPNHAMDIEKTASDFLKHWFDKKFDEYSLEFNDQLITAGGKVFSCQEIKDRLNTCLSFYEQFTNEKYELLDVGFEWNEEEARGLGHAEGFVVYDAHMQDDSRVHMEAPFKLYVSNEDGYWNIFYFVFPGFDW